ncbi:MAG TPA: hypothetical protein PKC39_07105 [Ferruginibacter sp.]|nr:hypothetical protein [Ferruginibacter sp.]HMP20709.1 hypothetical protein [Ferruginibacter sp.]
MKKMMLLAIAALLVTGASFAGDGKKCKKSKSCCKKEKSCCKKKDKDKEKTAKI